MALDFDKLEHGWRKGRRHYCLEAHHETKEVDRHSSIIVPTAWVLLNYIPIKVVNYFIASTNTPKV